MTHATVWIDVTVFAAVWTPPAADMFASARWVVRDTAHRIVAAKMARNHFRMSSSSELQARACARRTLSHCRVRPSSRLAVRSDEIFKRPARLFIRHSGAYGAVACIAWYIGHNLAVRELSVVAQQPRVRKRARSQEDFVSRPWPVGQLVGTARRQATSLHISTSLLIHILIGSRLAPTNT